MNAMKKWMKAATAAEQLELAATAGTTRNYLYQIAGGHRTPSAETAGRIVDAAFRIRKASKNRLPELNRASLSPTCRVCPHALRCPSLSTPNKG